MPLDLKNLGEVALWHAYCDGDEYMSPDDGVKMPSGFDAYTALPAATFAALVAEVEAARKAAPREATPVAWAVYHGDALTWLYGDEDEARHDAKHATPDFYRVIPLVRAPGGAS